MRILNALTFHQLTDVGCDRSASLESHQARTPASRHRRVAAVPLQATPAPAEPEAISLTRAVKRKQCRRLGAALFLPRRPTVGEFILYLEKKIVIESGSYRKPSLLATAKTASHGARSFGSHSSRECRSASVRQIFSEGGQSRFCTEFEHRSANSAAVSN